MQLIIKYNNRVRFLLFDLDISKTYTWVVRLNNKKVLQSLLRFKFFDEAGHKPSKIGIDQNSDFYNRSLKSSLYNNAIEIYSTEKEGKSIIAKRL